MSELAEVLREVEASMAAGDAELSEAAMYWYIGACSTAAEHAMPQRESFEAARARARGTQTAGMWRAAAQLGLNELKRAHAESL